MKRLIILPALLLCVSLFSQNRNKFAIEFVNNHYGEKIGDGVCIDLLNGIIDYADSVTGLKDSVMDDIVISDVKPGDIIDFQDVLFSDGKIAKSHTGIVYEVKGNGIFTIAEQNVGSSDSSTKIVRDGKTIVVVKDSRVRIDFFDMSDVVSGKVSFYRL